MEKVKESILVIDDNDINRRYVKTVLRGPEIDILLVESGFQALELIEDHIPAIILIDIQMPLMDGFECYDRLRKKLGEDIPMLAITAFSNSEEREEFISYGFNDSIMKPVMPDILRSIVAHWLSNLKAKKQEIPSLKQQDFDLATINELKRHANTTELSELYNDFIDEINIFYERLVLLKDTKNYPEILSILHIIKGNAGSLGFAKLSELTSKLEIDIKSDEDVSLSVRVQEIVDYSSEIFSVYKAQLTLNA